MEKPAVIKIRGEDGNITELEAYDSLISAAARARQYAQDGYPDRYAVFCQRQKDVSLFGKENYSDKEVEGVFLSLILRPSLFLAQSGFFRILAATALVTALEEHSSRELGIAWLTDIYDDQGKIGSVAIEGKLDDISFYEYVIVHFAVKTSEETFPARLDDLVRKVFESENTSVNMIIARTILSHFYQYYPYLKTPGAFIDTYIDKMILRGVEVQFLQNGKKKRAKVIGVERESGSLLLDQKGTTVRISSPRELILPKKIEWKET